MITVLLKCYIGIFALIFKEGLIFEAIFSCKMVVQPKIPPRSPDLDSIFFHFIDWKLPMMHYNYI